MDADVIIIGAGFSGLAAARKIRKAGKNPLILEARERVGGRSWSVPYGNHRIDMGPQYIGPTQDRMKALADEFNLKLAPSPSQGKRLFELAEQTVAFEEAEPPFGDERDADFLAFILKIDELAQTIPLDAPHKAPNAAKLDQITLSEWMKLNVKTQDCRDLLNVACSSLLGGAAHEVSFLFFLWYCRQGDSFAHLITGCSGAQDAYVKGGTQQIAERLAAELGNHLRLNTRALAVSQNRKNLTIQTNNGNLKAPFAIIAAPPYIQRRITFSPPLPIPRQDWINRLTMGRYMKAIALYDKPFWRDNGLCGEVASVRGPICGLYDESDGFDGNGALLGFIGADHAAQLRNISQEKREQAVRECLARWFGKQAHDTLHLVVKDWGEEEFTGGAPTAFAPPGLITQAAGGRHDPCGRIHWAGTEAATKWSGYMEGAVRAGEDAADAVLAAL